MAGVCNEHPWPANESANGCHPCTVEVCDFCRATPEWVYLSEPFVSTLTGVMKDGTTQSYSQYNHPEWAACGPCHDLIEAGDFDALAERSISADWDGRPHNDPHGKVREALKRDLMAFHREFAGGLKERPPIRVPVQ